MLLCREIVPGMIARRAGRIITVASGAGAQPFPNLSAYVVSKTALIRFSEQLAFELAAHGVSVFPIRPGTVRTAMLEESLPHLPFLQEILDRGLEFTPEAVARMVLKLASGCADSLSGRMFSVEEDIDAIVRRAEEVGAGEFHVLRLCKLN